jgi:hypothetical protein
VEANLLLVMIGAVAVNLVVLLQAMSKNKVKNEKDETQILMQISFLMLISPLRKIG